jgi:hypothetical protein
VRFEYPQHTRKEYNEVFRPITAEFRVKVNNLVDHNISTITERILTLFTGSTALRFTATDPPSTAKRWRILPMTQRQIAFEMNE